MARLASAARSGSILAYFSHSYREADRDVNSFFWRLCHTQGFFFTVDPESQFFSVPYLESMMALSNCFVAVITRRQGAPAGCSPYILFECGLAVQAQKPSLIFVEQGLSGKFLPRDPERVIAFNRQRLNDQAGEFSSAIAKLAYKVRGYRNPDLRLQQPIGLIVRAGKTAEDVYSPSLVEMLKVEMRKLERDLEIVKVDFDASFEFCLELEKYDFLILESREQFQIPWLAGYVLGRAIPCIKIYHLATGETPETAALPDVIARHTPRHTSEVPVEYWHDAAELVRGVAAHVAKFNTERIEFHSLADGLRYFRRAGRREAKVFISNARALNPLAQKLVAKLKLEGIESIHYQVKDTISIGEQWLPELERQVEQAGIFVALLSEEYLQSEWCLYEAQVALKRASDGKLRFHPYLLNDNLIGRLPLFGMGRFEIRDCSQDDERAIVLEAVRNIDQELKKGPGTAAPVGEGLHPAPGPPSTTLSEEDRGILVDILAARLTPEDQRPAWIKLLLIRATLYQQLAGEDFGGGAGASAIALVTKAEGLGLLPDGRNPMLLLVEALRRHELVGAEHSPFLNALAERLTREMASVARR